MKAFSACLFVFITLQARSQQDLVRYEEIAFSSDLEKRIFDDHFLHKKSDYFLLLMANGNLLNESAVQDAKNRFYSRLSMIADSGFDGKKNPKKVKSVYDELHKAFLARFSGVNKFEEVFYNGSYNCVSASALFALAFDNLKVPFTIKEKPTHVYLIAYPDNDKILVETTIPVGGSVQMNKSFQQDFVRVLKEQKVIDAHEYASNDTQILFDKYFFGGQEDIGLRELIGLQYVNDAILKLEQKRYIEALQSAEKSHLFYPSDRSEYLLMICAFEGFHRRTQKDLIHAGLLGKLARYKKAGITAEMVQGEFASVVQKVLFEEGDKAKLSEYFDHLQTLITNETLKNDLAFIYHYENGRMLYNKAKFKESVPYMETALTIKPKHDDASRLLIATIAQSFRNTPNKEVMRVLEGYAVKFPELMENNFFLEMLGTAYLSEIQFHFEMGNNFEGEKYKTIFESFQKDHVEVTYDSYLVGRAYSASAVYYFKKNQTTKARGILAKGLQISPNNYELISRQRMIH